MIKFSLQFGLYQVCVDRIVLGKSQVLIYCLYSAAPSTDINRDNACEGGNIALPSCDDGPQQGAHLITGSIIDGVCKSKAINVEIRRSPGKTFLLASLIRKLGEKVSSFMLKWNWVEIKLNNFYCLFSQPKYFLLLPKIFIYKLKNENRFYKAFSEIDLSMINFKWERLQNTNIILPRKMRVQFSVIAIALSPHIAGPNRNQEENKSFLT